MPLRDRKGWNGPGADRRQPGGSGIKRLRSQGRAARRRVRRRQGARRHARQTGARLRALPLAGRRRHQPLLAVRRARHAPHQGPMASWACSRRRASTRTRPPPASSRPFRPRAACPAYSTSRIGRYSSKDVHASFKFVALIFGGEARRFDRTDCAFFLHDTATIKNDRQRCFPLTADDLHPRQPQHRHRARLPYPAGCRDHPSASTRAIPSS